MASGEFPLDQFLHEESVKRCGEVEQEWKITGSNSTRVDKNVFFIKKKGKSRRLMVVDYMRGTLTS